MAATRGPAPKRSSERRRRNKESKPDKVQAIGPVTVPEPDPDWHPIAVDWFRSLGESGQAEYFEPSDWQGARVVAETMTRYFDRPSAVMFAALWSAMGDLLTTEAQRRRVRLEVEREGEVDPAKVTALDEYRQRVG